MIHAICSRCKQGYLQKVKIEAMAPFYYFCGECETIWFSKNNVTNIYTEDVDCILLKTFAEKNGIDYMDIKIIYYDQCDLPIPKDWMKFYPENINKQVVQAGLLIYDGKGNMKINLPLLKEKIQNNDFIPGLKSEEKKQLLASASKFF